MSMADEQGRGRGADDRMTTAEADTFVRPAVRAQRGPDVDTVNVQTVQETARPARERVRWGAVWGGLLAALTALLILSLLGLAVGLSVVNSGATAAGGPPVDTGRNSAIWEGASLIIAFLIGGYVAGRTANTVNRGTAALNGLMVFLLSVPLLLAVVLGGFGNVAGALNLNFSQLQSALTHTSVSVASGDLVAARNAAWGALIGVLIGLIASALGGLLGARNRRAHAAVRYVVD